MDHKSQLINHWIFGTGPTFGLEVQRLDGESLPVSPGIGVDALGRYLFVDEPVVCRLQTLRGFDALTEESTLLWLSYQEKTKDLIFVAGNQDEQQEYAVSAECCAFSLNDWGTLSLSAVERTLYFHAVLYEDEALRVRQMVPRILSSQRPVYLRLILENLSLEPGDIQLHYTPELPGFHTEPDGEGDLSEPSVGTDQWTYYVGGSTNSLHHSRVGALFSGGRRLLPLDTRAQAGRPEQLS